MNRRIIIRNARPADLERIVRIDKEAYENIYNGPVGSSKIMDARIKISSKWFFVAEVDGVILEYLSLQPTKIGIEKFKSWDESTDGGTLGKTYSENGPYVYGVALTASKNGKGLGLSSKLFAAAACKIISERKKYVYFSGRMPGFSKMKGKMSAEEYYNARTVIGRKKVALDPQIRMYESFGFKRVRLVKNGFRGDKESCNYSVIFVINNPLQRFPYPKLMGKLYAIAMGNNLLSRFL